MIEHWYAALHSRLGVIVETQGGVERVRQALYRARAEAHDETLNDIAICLSPTNPDDLWLVKKRQQEPDRA